MDWGLGRYERTAAQLLPAARAVVEAAAPRPGEQLVDVGCGTGNAALLASERGAAVIGVDPAPRLLQVAREEAALRGLDVRLLEGEAASLPLPDVSADVLVSVFAAIFAPDAPAAAAELARVARPRSRIVLSAWEPSGAVGRAIGVYRAALAAAGAPAGPARFPWHEPESLRGLFAPHGFAVEVHPHSLAFVAGSPHEYIDAELRDHPAWVEGRPLLEQRGEMAAVRERMLEVVTEANEDPGALRLTSRYVIAVATRG